MTPGAGTAHGVTAIVLAGGRSSRFGGPKLIVELDGLTLLERAVRTIGSVADEVIVAGTPAAPAAPTPQRGASTPDLKSVQTVPTRTVTDDEPFAGPLAALAGALRDVSTALAIVAGGDMPGLVPAVLESMLDRLRVDVTLDVVLLTAPDPSTERRQVLPLALRVETASIAARAAVEAGDRSLVRLVDRLRSIEIPAPEWLALDPDGRTLLDVDRPSDLARIHRELR